MKTFIITFLIGSCIFLSYALPVTKTKKDEKNEKPNTPETPNVEEALEYERYLKEVVEALKSDPEFRKKLENATDEDIRTGNIAEKLDYASHNVRTKLDEIKRRELERLRSLANQEYELENHIDRDHTKTKRHIDHNNKNTFEIEDLKILIKKTSEDLDEINRKREQTFKEYEMQKEFEKEMIKKELNEEQRKKFEEKQKELIEMHRKHEKVHYPGNKAQLEEVWEKQDHMDKEDFDARTFFALHDLDGNGFWDETEVKALFVKELDKVYQEGLAEDDMIERAEDMERMRERAFQEKDTDHDGLISLEEFLEQTKREEYNRDPEWQTIDRQPQYTHEEYLEYERRRREEIDRKIAQGLLPPHPNMPQGYYANDPNAAYQTGHYPSNNQQHPQMHYQDPQQQHMQQQQQYHQQQQQYQQYQQPEYHQQQYQGQHVELNPNQVYQQIPVQQQQYHQQPQPGANGLPPQHPTVKNLSPQQPVASNADTQKQPIINNIPQQQQPLATNGIPQHQVPINNAGPEQPINNVQQSQQNNIPQKH